MVAQKVDHLADTMVYKTADRRVVLSAPQMADTMVGQSALHLARMVHLMVD